MIKELFYEWCFFCVGFITCDSSKRGFFDNRNLYIREKWLKWEVIPLEQIKQKGSNGK